MGCGKEETKPTRASPSWTPALSAWPRLAQTHKHAINADIYDTLTSSGGQNKWEQSFPTHRGNRCSSKNVWHCQRCTAAFMLTFRRPWLHRAKSGSHSVLKVSSQQQHVSKCSDKLWSQICSRTRVTVLLFFLFFLIPTCFNFIEFSAAHLTSVGKNLQWEWNFKVTGKHYCVEFFHAAAAGHVLCASGSVLTWH